MSNIMKEQEFSPHKDVNDLLFKIRGILFGENIKYNIQVEELFRNELIELLTKYGARIDALEDEVRTLEYYLEDWQERYYGEDY